jgi:hypothetical protein
LPAKVAGLGRIVDAGDEDGEDGVEAPPSLRRRRATEVDHDAVVADLDVESRVGRTTALVAERHGDRGAIVVLAQARQRHHSS